jgi:GT2 family glycosyltransferase/glycosyltransferase involved in cell wall biosynthesis
MPDLSIIILNWNVAGLLVECLRSLPSACSDRWAETEVIVVDNASTDDSIALVRAEFPHVQLISLPHNAGFSAGNNEGIRASKSRYILLLNPDTVCHPGSISRLCDYMDAHPSVGVAGPRLLNPDGSLQPSRRRFPTFATALLESTPLQPFFRDSAILSRFYMLNQPDDIAQPAGWLSGAALLCRRVMLAQCGLFDPGYFMFSEEMDLCRRAYDAGWEVVYLPDARITHFGGQSTGQAVASRHINFNTSKTRYFRKHEGPFAGNLLRIYLLSTYVVQSISEGAKWLLGHKRPLRAARLRTYSQVLRSGLRPPRRPRARPSVLLITGEFPPARGGVGDYTCRLSLALRAQGTAVQVLTRSCEDEGRKTKDESVRSPVDERNANYRRSSIPYSAFRIPRITPRAVLRAVRGTGASVAHIQYQTGAYEMRPTVNVLPLLLRLLWGGPVVVTFHDLLIPYLFPKAGLLREWANRLLARSATAVVATNPADAARLRSWGVRRVELIPIGSNIPNNPPSDFNRDLWRANHGISSDTTLLAYFGFLNSTKGISDLLGALALLREGASSSTAVAYRLMMVGGGLGSSDPTNRATAAQLDTLAQSLGVDDLILWTGFLTPGEVSAALLSADMAVLPYADGASFRRGSLMAVLEHALPVITTQTKDEGRRTKDERRPTADDRNTNPQSAFVLRPRNPQSIWPSLENGVNALLVPPGDPQALAVMIERLACDLSLRLSLSAGSRKLARFFGWERIAEMHRSLYNSDELQSKKRTA